MIKLSDKFFSWLETEHNQENILYKRFNKMSKAYCSICEQWSEVGPGFINAAEINCPNCGNVRKDYPYWKEEFDELFKGHQIYYSPNLKIHKLDDTADSYRVFMILCNNNYNKSRMEVLEMIKNSTREFPIQIEDEFFWTEKE